MWRTTWLLASLTLSGGMAAAAQPDSVAINVLLEPAPALAERAQALNSQLRRADPSGFALDASHVPHISLLHRFVRRDELERMFADLTEVLARTPIPRELQVSRLEVAPWGDKRMVSLSIEPDARLTALQGAVLGALAHLATVDGDGAAFVRAADDPPVSAQTVDYVRTFVPQRTGKAFAPHLTIGLAAPAAAQTLQAVPFAPARYGATRIAVYQLGDAGTARRRLWP